MRDAEMHMVSGFITAVVTVGLFVPVVWLQKDAQASKPDFGEMDAIEATVAFTKDKKPKQPQKKFREPEKQKVEGVSHDEKQKPIEKKPDEKKKHDDKEPDITKFHHASDDDDDQPVGKPTTDPGDFNGNEFGWAPTTKGHPFWQKLAQDIHQNWEIPQILNVKGAPVGCFHITADGKIADTQFKTKAGDAALDDSVQRALDAVKKLRNDHPTPVPTELLGATNRWICFRFDPDKPG